MIRIISVMALLALLALIACQPAGPTGLTDADKAANEAATKAWMAAANSADWVRLAANYSEDTIFMPPNQPAVEGRADLQKWFEAFPPIDTIALETLEIEGIGDLAYVRGIYSVTFTPEGGQPTTDSGKYIEIRRKQKDGAWLTIRDIYNSDLPVSE